MTTHPRAAVIFFALLAASTANAGTFFVRAGATGANDGSSWATAFTALPSKPLRGSTYYVAGGTYASGTVLDTPSGSAVVIIKGATAADHGSDVGWVKAYSVCASDGGTSASFPSGWTVSTNGWTIDGACGGGSDNGGVASGGYGFKTKGAAKGSGALGFTFLTSVSDITIAHYEIDGTSCCTMGNDELGLHGMLCVGACSVNGVFDHLSIHDIGGAGFLMGGNITLQHSLIARNRSTPGAHAEGWSYRGGTAIIRWNIFEDVRGTGQFVELYETGTNHEVYGNVFKMLTPPCPGCNGSAWPVVDNTSTGVIHGLKFYNNTIYGLDGNPGVGSINGSTGYDIKNNLWFNNAYGASISGTLSNNTVWGTYWYGGASGAASDWRCVQAGNKDPSGNCAGNNSVVAPSAALTFVAPPQDLRPMGNSISGIAITGVALGAPYDVDMNGVQRTQWTRGAYEYGAVVPPVKPAPPTNLRVVQ